MGGGLGILLLTMGIPKRGVIRKNFRADVVGLLIRRRGSFDTKAYGAPFSSFSFFLAHFEYFHINSVYFLFLRVF